MFRPREGQMVSCPKDRGQPAYRGTASSVGEEVQRNHKGDPFVWLTVTNQRGTRAI